MDVSRWQRIERVLDAAFESDPTQWDALVEDLCGTDRELRREVEALLGRYAKEHGFLDVPPSATAAAVLAAAPASPDTRREAGRRIGAYRIVRQLGQGGMARVFLAERADGAFAEQVAIKVLRPGLDSELDRDRLRAERQILASLNHPNIARLFDGGVTDDGLPYLVLEYVDGQPIDRYCDQRHHTVRQRLERFLTAATATQFAHRNLVIHRDLKPSNVLVTADGTVKLLDFGLAKLLLPNVLPHEPPTTRTGHRWMTPEYAAPEQIRNEPVSTLTDVYQLGAMLYHLLVGRAPFGMRSGGSLHELEHAILHDEPVPPSAAVHALRGDLDAIVLKALRKAPDERYSSVQALADDVSRYLSGHAVMARRPSAIYRSRKFVRRHRWGVAAAAAFIVLLGVYAATVTVQRARIERALTRATIGAQKAEQLSTFMLGLFEASERGKAFGDTLTARALLDRGLTRARELTGQPEVRAQMVDVVGQLHAQLGDDEQARPLFEEALAIRRRLLGDAHVDVAASLANLAYVHSRGGRFAEAVRLYREAIAIQRPALGVAHPATLESLYGIAEALHSSGDARGALPMFDEWMRIVMTIPTEQRVNRADQLVKVGQLLLIRGDLAGAERAYREAVSARRVIYGDRHPSVASALHRVGTVLRTAGKLEESERAMREAVDLLRSAYPEGHPELGLATRGLAMTLHREKKLEEAESLYREVLAMNRRFNGANHVFVGNALEDLGRVATDRGDYAGAEAFLREGVRVYQKAVGDDDLLTARARLKLGVALLGRGALGEAEPLLVHAFTAFKDRRMPGALGELPRREAINALVRLYEAQGRPNEAAKYRELSTSQSP